MVGCSCGVGEGEGLPKKTLGRRVANFPMKLCNKSFFNTQAVIDIGRTHFSETFDCLDDKELLTRCWRSVWEYGWGKNGVCFVTNPQIRSTIARVLDFLSVSCQDPVLTWYVTWHSYSAHIIQNSPNVHANCKKDYGRPEPCIFGKSWPILPVSWLRNSL